MTGPYSLLANHGGGHYILHTDGTTTRSLGFFSDEADAQRVVELLNRHGTEDVPAEALDDLQDEGGAT